MKYYLVFTFFIVITLLSCKKDSNPASMEATIDGTKWTAITRVSKHFVSTGMYTITGTSASGEVLVITIKGEEEGSYNSSTSIDSLNAQVGAVFQPDASSPTEDNFFSTSGTVTITELDKNEQTISGTFSFTMSKMSETKSITNGKFENLNYSESSQ
ncbi:MAG: hypothetical protein Kow0068_08360 [Marinilabiliales bacterium]